MLHECKHYVMLLCAHSCRGFPHFVGVELLRKQLPGAQQPPGHHKRSDKGLADAWVWAELSEVHLWNAGATSILAMPCFYMTCTQSVDISPPITICSLLHVFYSSASAYSYNMPSAGGKAGCVRSPTGSHRTNCSLVPPLHPLNPLNALHLLLAVSALLLPLHLLHLLLSVSALRPHTTHCIYCSLYRPCSHTPPTASTAPTAHCISLAPSLHVLHLLHQLHLLLAVSALCPR